MRVFEPQTPTGDIAADVENVIERALHTTEGCPRHVVVEMILHRLGGAGYGLARREDLFPATAPVATETEAKDAEPETEEQPAKRYIGTVIPWGEDDPEEDPLLPEDIIQELDTERIVVTRDGLVYVTQTGYRAFRRWLPLAGLQGPHYDLAAVERWLSEQVSLPVRETRLCKEDLSRALRGIQGFRAEVERLEQRPALSAQAITKALQAAIALEKAGNVLGWSEVERLTGLRPAPRYARRAA